MDLFITRNAPLYYNGEDYKAIHVEDKPKNYFNSNDLEGQTINGHLLTKRLGSGYCGVAYLTNEGKVMKITDHTGEIAIFSEIYLGNLSIVKPYVCEIYDIKPLVKDPDLIYSYNYYCILKEYLMPSCDSKKYFKWNKKLPHEAFKMLGIWDYEKSDNVGINNEAEFKIFDFCTDKINNLKYRHNYNYFNNQNTLL